MLTYDTDKTQQKTLAQDDKKIAKLNAKLQKAKEALDICNAKVASSQMAVHQQPGVAKHRQRMGKATKAKERAEATYINAVQASTDAAGSGSGKWAYYYLVVPTTKEPKLHESLQL